MTACFFFFFATVSFYVLWCRCRPLQWAVSFGVSWWPCLIPSPWFVVPVLFSTFSVSARSLMWASPFFDSFVNFNAMPVKMRSRLPTRGTLLYRSWPTIAWVNIVWYSQALMSLCPEKRLLFFSSIFLQAGPCFSVAMLRKRCSPDCLCLCSQFHFATRPLRSASAIWVPGLADPSFEVRPCPNEWILSEDVESVWRSSSGSRQTRLQECAGSPHQFRRPEPPSKNKRKGGL